MAIEFTFDPQTLLQAISDEAPCGTDPRLDTSPTAPFLRMKDARATARRKERAIDVDPDGASPADDWNEVAQAGFEILSQHGKDLEVTAWLIEALVRLDGFAGLATGMVVAQGLVRTWWDDIFPLPDEEGNEPRLGPFTALNGVNNDGTLIQPMRKVPLTVGTEPFGLWQYEQAIEISHITDTAKRDARLSSGGIKLEDFEAAVQATPVGFYRKVLTEIDAALKAVGDVSDAFAERVGVDAPPAGALRAVLNTTLDAVKVFAAGKLEQAVLADSAAADAAAQETADAPSDDAPGGAATEGSLPSGKPRNRAQALQQILQIAAYFRETEPHSPISYTLEEAVRRSRMPLDQLLSELIIDSDARKYFYLASGLRVPSHDDGSV